MGVQKHNMRSMMTSLAVRSEEEIDSAFFSKGGGGREGGGGERKVRLTTKESASATKWLENEGISSYAVAAVMFEGATGAVERENELLRKQWPEGDIERGEAMQDLPLCHPRVGDAGKVEVCSSRAKEHSQKE